MKPWRFPMLSGPSWAWMFIYSADALIACLMIFSLYYIVPLRATRPTIVHACITTATWFIAIHFIALPAANLLGIWQVRLLSDTLVMLIYLALFYLMTMVRRDGD